VYAILAPEFKRVKIGRAKNPVERMMNMRSGCPCPVELHSAEPSDNVFYDEAVAHGKLAHARVHGEWFDATDWHVRRWLAERKRRLG
jgi:hypothetical protein